ncbi:putative surface protease GP63 [Trypanosoma theileri]|uniref:Leishmanolysin-like peptidase n=1 Tax=Trypanosoma theileri TaxID=67003 RepID=A0A1X0P7R3_9TRYP|nr:putative surface protease GP63 [Trypanosoma theileri]ORC92885.1 putative surface protease GP63 [Trypanosoma theileri]
MLFESVCVSFGFVEHRCTFDQRVKHGEPLPVVRELPRKGRNGLQAYIAANQGWERMRFGVSIEDLKDDFRYCTRAGQRRPDFEGGTLVCTEADILTTEKKILLVNHLLPESIKLHTDRLLVERMDGIVVDWFVTPLCSPFKIPVNHHYPGVTGVDILLYVAAGPTPEGVIAWGVPCYTLDNGRPVVGAMNFGPRYITATRLVSRAAAHEIAHVLGFSSFLFAKSGMLSIVPILRGKRDVLVVSSKKTLEVMRKHFNCDDVVGMELEDEGSDGTAHSHWERRNVKDELMAGLSGVSYYTALTMAAFEDLGYYRANWGMEEQMSWGKDAGCEFLYEKCVKNNNTRYPDMFCTKKFKGPRCTSDRLALGNCDLESFGRTLPLQYQYFTETSIAGGGRQLTDHCPVIKPAVRGVCTDVENYWPGSRVGPESRCLHGDSLHIGNRFVGDVCVEVSCNVSGILYLRYLGEDNWYPCPEGGGIIPKKPFTKGRILCPKYMDVCVTLALNITNKSYIFGKPSTQYILSGAEDWHNYINGKREEPQHKRSDSVANVFFVLPLMFLELLVFIVLMA